MIRFERDGNKRLIIWIGSSAFRELSDQFSNNDRFSYSVLTEKGYENLILDWPMGRVIAALDRELDPEDAPEFTGE